MYDEKAKDRTMRYIKEKREKIGLNLPIGSKERYKASAASRGMSLTALIVELLEAEIKKSEQHKAN